MEFNYKKMKIRMIEKDKQWTDIHQEANVSWSSISKINKGQSVTLDTVGKIAIYLECDIGDLVSVKIE